MEDNEVLLATDFDCFSELADIIGAERAVLELNRIIESGIDVYLGKDLVEAFEWSDSPQGDHFWGGIKAMGLAGKKWQEGEERMNNIAQNGNGAEHYDSIAKPDVIEHDNNNKYSRKIKTIVVDGIDHDIYVDVYDVLTAFKTTNPANDHAIKKQLATGQRGVKGVIQDLTEARDSLNRAIEIEKNK